MVFDLLKLKRLALRVCWVLQIMFFTYGYFWGFQNTRDAKFFIKNISIQDNYINEKKLNLIKLQEKLYLWHNESWLYEKRARKVLNLATAEEEHFLIN